MDFFVLWSLMASYPYQTIIVMMAISSLITSAPTFALMSAKPETAEEVEKERRLILRLRGYSGPAGIAGLSMMVLLLVVTTIITLYPSAIR